MTKKRLVQLGVVGALVIVLAVVGVIKYHGGKFFGKAETLGVAPVNLIVQNYWAEKYIVAVEQPNFGASGTEKIMTNYTDSTFRSDLEINRGTLAVYLGRAIKTKPCCNDIYTEDCRSCSTYQRFSDVSLTDSNWTWAWPYIEALAQDGILGGYPDGTFRPFEKVKISTLRTLLQRVKYANVYPPGLQEHYANEHKTTPLTDDSFVTREMMAAFVAYNLKLPGESDYPSVYLQWLFPIDPNAGFDFGYEIHRNPPFPVDEQGKDFYVQDPPEQGMEEGSDLGMFYDKSMTGSGTYTYYVYLFNRDGDYSAPATVSITVP
jgi:hypothetical protein